MRTSTNLWMLVLLCCAADAVAADIQLRVVRKGRDVAMPRDTALTTNVIALIESCTYHSDRDSGRPEIWQQALASDSFVHIVFAGPAKFRFEGASNHGREAYLVHEILVGLPEGKWAGPLLVKAGTNIHAFGKYDARDLKRVAFEPALKLSSVRPYSELAKFGDKKR